MFFYGKFLTSPTRRVKWIFFPDYGKKAPTRSDQRDASADFQSLKRDQIGEIFVQFWILLFPSMDDGQCKFASHAFCCTYPLSLKINH